MSWLRKTFKKIVGGTSKEPTLHVSISKTPASPPLGLEKPITIDTALPLPKGEDDPKTEVPIRPGSEVPVIPDVEKAPSFPVHFGDPTDPNNPYARPTSLQTSRSTHSGSDEDPFGLPLLQNTVSRADWDRFLKLYNAQSKSIGRRASDQTVARNFVASNGVMVPDVEEANLSMKRSCRKKGGAKHKKRQPPTVRNEERFAPDWTELSIGDEIEVNWGTTNSLLSDWRIAVVKSEPTSHVDDRGATYYSCKVIYPLCSGLPQERLLSTFSSKLFFPSCQPLVSDQIRTFLASKS